MNIFFCFEVSILFKFVKILSQSFKKYHDTIGVTKIIVIILKTANDEETIFLKKLVIRLLKLGEYYLIYLLLCRKAFF